MQKPFGYMKMRLFKKEKVVRHFPQVLREIDKDRRLDKNTSYSVNGL